jgi:hypothetical protein
MAQHDPESTALATALELLSELEPAAQQRVLDYIAQRLAAGPAVRSTRVAAPNTLTTIDPPQRKGGRPKGSTNKPKKGGKGGKRGPKPGSKRPGRPSKDSVAETPTTPIVTTPLVRMDEL